MIKDITAGQFFPGNSLLHRTDARFKIMILLVFLVTVLASSSTASFAAVLALTVTLVLLSRINVKVILRSVKPLAFILAFNAFAPCPDSHCCGACRACFFAFGVVFRHDYDFSERRFAD